MKQFIEYSLQSRVASSKHGNACKMCKTVENVPAGETVGVFGCSRELQGPRAVKFHFLLADGESAIQRALASLETLMPISARYMQSTKVALTHRNNHDI